MKNLPRVHKRCTPRQREEIVESFRKSSLTQRQFAAQAGISVSGLQLWLRQASASKSVAPVRLVPIPNLIASPASGFPYRLVLPNGVALEVRQECAPAQLESLLKLAAGL